MVFLECELIEKESQDSLETFGGSKKVVLPADLDLFPKGQPLIEKKKALHLEQTLPRYHGNSYAR